MESSKKPIVKVREEKGVLQDIQPLKVIEWEDYEQELARLCSLTSALEEAKSKKLMLEEKLQSSIQIEATLLSWSNELDQKREKLEYRKLVMGNMSMHSKAAREKVRKQEEQFSAEIRSLLIGGSSLSVANKRMQKYELKYRDKYSFHFDLHFYFFKHDLRDYCHWVILEQDTVLLI